MHDPATDLAIPFRSVAEILARHEAAHPEKTAIVDLDGGKEIDFAGLRAAVERIAAWLAARGVGRGDRVVVLSDERIEKLLVFLAVWRVGAVACPFHVETGIPHLRAIIGYIDPRLVLWQSALDGERILSGLGYDSARFSAWPEGDAGPGEVFASAAALDPRRAPAGGNAAADTACIFSTSGTTDRPKCVEWDHLGLWLCGLSSLDFTGMTGDDRLLEYRTFSWLSPQILALMPFLQTGLTLHMARRFSRRRFFEWIEDRRISVAIGVPTVINMLLNQPVEIEPARIASLRLMTSSSAPLSPDRWRRFEALYGITLLQFYGASEGGWLCGNRHDRRKLGTVGQPARHIGFAILDADGAPCPPGVEGEIAIRGPQTATASISPSGTYRDMRPARLAEWHRSGDIGVADADGFVTVTGRVKDLIIRGGVNIAPLEIDAVLMRLPGIEEAAAVGVPDPIYGEEVAAFVVARAGETVEADRVIAGCAPHLPASKLPKSVFVVDALPRSERGKIRRDALKDLWRERAGET
ncbi:MAG: class I adenylate-forming enzyme family protein [Defluviicoccus sp.]|nr:class I adenylate-forming enzyme family protein [Defluviicoccus sp.]